MRMTGRGPMWLLGAVVGLAWMGSAAADENIQGLGIQRTVDCEGGTVTITGTSHRLTLRGRCDRVVLSGTGSVVHVESLGRVTVSGVNNRVEWERGLDGNDPRIQKSGINNEVVQVKGGGSASSRGSSGSRKGSGSGSVDVGGGAVVVEDGRDRVTVGSDGVTVESGSGKSGRKDKVVVDSGGTTVTVDNSSGTVKAGGGTVRSSGKAGTLTVAENDQERTYDCAGGTAVIQGNDNVLTLRNCPELIVNGNSNTLTLQGPVRVIRALGNENEITYSQGADGKAPNVESLGSGNNISRSGK
jgi:hypothetical protein